MNEHPSILTEDQALALLRAGRAGSVPLLTDPTATAIHRGRRMRQRRHVFQGASAFALAMAGVLGIVAIAPGLDGADRSVVLPPVGTGVPADQAASVADLNRVFLATALGPSFVPDGGEIRVRPGSAAARALPVGYTGAANVTVEEVAGDEAQICAPNPAAVPAKDCDRRVLDKREVLLRTYPGSAGGADSEPVSSRTAYYIRPDGRTVVMTLLARPDPADPRLSDASIGPDGAPGPAAVRDAVVAWLGAYSDEMAKAAIDYRIRTTDPAAQRPMSNEEVLAQALGGSFRLDGGEVTFDANSQAAGPLPEGTTASATLRYLDRTALEDLCRLPACSRQVFSGNRVVWIEDQADYVASERAVLGRSVVYYVQPDDELLEISLRVRGPEIGMGEVDAQRAMFRTWLEVLHDALVSAATDPRVSKGNSAG